MANSKKTTDIKNLKTSRLSKKGQTNPMTDSITHLVIKILVTLLILGALVFFYMMLKGYINLGFG